MKDRSTVNTQVPGRNRHGGMRDYGFVLYTGTSATPRSDTKIAGRQRVIQLLSPASYYN
jgi:hypothetical protein